LKSKTTERIILGIDPGTNITGYGVIKVTGDVPELIAIGAIDLKKYRDHFLKLKYIFDRTSGIIDEYHPDELAVEAPFYGKNVQSMLKLGRAQGAAIAAALSRSLPVFEYAPRKIKMSITGQGAASKEQVAGMLMNILNSAWTISSWMQQTDWPQLSVISTRPVILSLSQNTTAGRIL